MVEGAALEMLCPERDLGFEFLTLRQILKEVNCYKAVNFFCFSALASTRIDLPMRIQTTARYAGGIKA